MLTSFRPGQPWLDTSGHRIQAHGGSIITVDGAFYWYGENKEKSVPGAHIWHWGVRMYRSRDLYNWEDVGLVLPPVTDDKDHPLHPSQGMDRPHILYCARTGRYVMWMKILGDGKIQSQTLAVADQVTGPYTVVKKCWHPLDYSCGDFDLVADPATGKGYYIFEKVHSELIIADLTGDYTGVTGRYTSHFPHPHPPFVREAPAYFRRGGLHYLFTSGTTGYFPNPSQVACAKDIHGPWKVLGDPHPDDPEHASFRSQITSVFKHPGKKDLYIALADRWLVDLPKPLPDFGTAFGEAYDPARNDWTKLKALRSCTAHDIHKADYVWLPVRFDNEMAYLDWYDQWRWEDGD